MERQKACESWWRVCDIVMRYGECFHLGYLGGTHDKSRDFWSHIVLRRSVGSVNSEGIDGPVPRMQDAYETQPSRDVPGVLEFFISPYSLQLLAKYVYIVILAFLDLSISTTKRRYCEFNSFAHLSSVSRLYQSHGLWALTIAIK